jgi:hypothetical protein
VQLKKSDPDLKLGEIGKATGAAWGTLTDKVRCLFPSGLLLLLP